MVCFGKHYHEQLVAYASIQDLAHIQDSNCVQRVHKDKVQEALEDRWDVAWEVQAEGIVHCNKAKQADNTVQVLDKAVPEENKHNINSEIFM